MSHPLRSACSSVLLLALAAGPASGAVEPAVKCQVLRLKLAASYASCLLKTDAKALVAGTGADHTACDGKMQTKWAAIEAKYGGDCPPTNEVTLVEDILSECTADALVPPATYDVVLGVSNAVTLGAVFFTVDYASSDGEFAGSGALVDCVNLAAGAAFAADDDDVSKALQVGVMAPTPIATPSNLVTCTFDRQTWGLPDAEDFTISILDAVDGNGDDIAPVVEIVSITPAP